MKLRATHRFRRWCDNILGALALVVLGISITGHIPVAGPSGKDESVMALLVRFGSEEQFLVLLLALSAMLLAMIAKQARLRRDALRRYWWVLAALFAAAVAVKVLPVYSGVVAGLRHLDSGAGMQVSSVVMVVISCAVAIGAGIYFLRFLASLPKRQRWSFISGGVIFLFGAIGIEGFSEWAWAQYGPHSVPYATADVLEGLFEMAGLIVFVDGLLFTLAESRIESVSAVKSFIRK
jgi:hypothetical protein